MRSNLADSIQSRIKVTYVVSTLQNAGPIRVLYNLIYRLDKNKFDINIVTLSPETSNSMEDDFIALNVPIYKLNLSRLAMLFYGLGKFSKILNNICPDIIHSNGFRPDYYVLKYKRTKILFSTIQNYPQKDYILSYGKLLGNLMAKKQIDMIKHFTCTIACSHSVAKDLLSTFNIETHVIHNGINIDKIPQNNEKTKILARRKLGISQDKRIFLFVGSLSKRKNPVNLIDSFIRSNIIRDSMLILIGDGELWNDCAIISNPAVVMVGNVFDEEKYLSYLEASDIYVSSSTSEGLPTAVIEAMGAGLPVILSDIFPHQEIVEMEENTGKLFSLQDKKELIHLFNESQTWDLNMMSECAKRCVLNHFSDYAMSSAYENKYVSAMEGTDDMK